MRKNLFCLILFTSFTVKPFLVGNSLLVIYSDPAIESDIETAKRKQKTDSFGL
jgi:hypothetical protein